MPQATAVTCGGQGSSRNVAQTRKGSPQEREPARQRLRECKGVKFAEQKKVAFSIVSSDFPVLLFLLSKVAQKKKKQKENAQKVARKRGLFEKSPLLTPLKTFRQLTPECRACTPKATYQPIRRTARCPPPTVVRKGYNSATLRVRHSALPLFWRCRARCRNRWN